MPGASFITTISNWGSCAEKFKVQDRGQFNNGRTSFPNARRLTLDCETRNTSGSVWLTDLATHVTQPTMPPLLSDGSLGTTGELEAYIKRLV
jgi:hypothetical protein